jgi:hypothetical protein
MFYKIIRLWQLSLRPLWGRTVQPATMISGSIVTPAPNIVGLASVPCTRAQWPTLIKQDKQFVKQKEKRGKSVQRCRRRPHKVDQELNSPLHE